MHKRIIGSTIDHANLNLHSVYVWAHMRQNIIHIKIKEIKSRLQLYVSVDTFIEYFKSYGSHSTDRYQ